MYLTEREVELLQEAISFFEKNGQFPIFPLGVEPDETQRELDAINTKLTIYNQETFQ